MKRLVVCVMLLLFASGANAEIQEFRYFSLDVPDGWDVIEDGATVTVIAGDKSASLSLTADDPQGKTIEELAKSFADELHGTEPEKDKDGAYSFEFNNGVSQVVIDGDEDLYLLIIGTGIERNGELLGEILESLEMK